MGTALALAACISAAIFLWKVIWRFILWTSAKGWRSPARSRRGGALLSAIGDIVFLTRLLRVNPGLWPGEWLFHVSFTLVIFRHLVFFLDPVPSWVAALQVPGIAAGYVLPASLLYILVFRYVFERGRYVSLYNLFLTLSILAISLTGLLIRNYMMVDLVGVKSFFIDTLALSPPADAPGNWLFLAHLASFLVLLPLLPTHIFTAPVTLIEARKRDGEKPLHED